MHNNKSFGTENVHQGGAVPLGMHNDKGLAAALWFT